MKGNVFSSVQWGDSMQIEALAAYLSNMLFDLCKKVRNMDFVHLAKF